MAVSWPAIKSLAIMFGPMLLPKILAFYRSLRAPSNSTPIPLAFRPSLAVNLLFISSLLALASTLPYFSPPNIFHQTASRLQTPTNVLFTRLAAVTTLTPWHESLRSVFEAGGLEARLLYLRFGPDVLATCPFADPKAADAATTYMFYALPTLLAPHILHMLVLGAATSGALVGRDGERWRVFATIAGVVLAVTELVVVFGYDHLGNAKAAKIDDADMFFWKARVVRGVAIAAVDGALGWLVWMAATRRAFVWPKSGAEKVENITRTVEGTLGKLRGLGAVRNVVYRQAPMRANVEHYWVNEDRLMSQVMEDGEVRRALTTAIEGSDMGRLQREAETYVDSLLPSAITLQQGVAQAQAQGTPAGRE